MKEFLEKLAPYHFFNYLLPGALFVILAEKFLNYDLYQTDIIFGLLLYYFIGLVISRFGSLIIEPILQNIKFITFTSYQEFLKASKNDSKIEILSEVNNMYRTLFTVFFVLAILKLYSFMETTYPILVNWNQPILFGLILILFLFAYRKQSQYITDRVKATNTKKIKNS